MEESEKEAHIRKMTRFLDALDLAAETGPAVFDALFNSPPAALSVHEISVEKRFPRVSRGHHARLGFEPADLVGRLASDFVMMKMVSEFAMTQIVQNLIENAIKFMGEQRDPQIRIGARPEPSEAVFFVSDNGIGIEPRHRDKVFDLFEKLGPGADGTGVGLALVKRIVEAHGGRVWVESEGLGWGSTFCFTLGIPA